MNKIPYEKLIERLAVGIIVYDEAQNLLYANIKAREILGINEGYLKDGAVLPKSAEALSGAGDNARVVLGGYEYVLKTAEISNGMTAAVFIDAQPLRKGGGNKDAEFFSNAVHELKTPITAIMGFSELLSLNANAEELKPLATNIYRNSVKMSELIRDMTELTRLDASKEDEPDSIVCMREIANFVCSSLTPFASSRGVRIFVRGDCAVRGGQRMLERLLSNLVSNAVKYNVEGGSVYVDLYESNARSVIKVFDTGRGIESCELEKIFERFYCVDKGAARGSGSTGLGLAIVKEIAALYNGQIAVRSVPLRGSEFTVTFEAPDGSAEYIKDDDDRGVFDAEARDILGDESLYAVRRIDGVLSVAESAE